MKHKIAIILVVIGICCSTKAALAQTNGRLLMGFISLESTLKLIDLKDFSKLSEYIHRSSLPDIDPLLVNWLKFNVSPQTQLPYSFYISKENKMDVFQDIGKPDSVEATIERIIIEEGLVIYDGAVGQIVHTMLGGKDDLERAALPLKIYWDGSAGELASVRAGYPINSFVYDPDNPARVSSDLDDRGKRGFIFRIINANGKYTTYDPLDGKTHMEDFPTWPTIHWEDWKPVAGENAWVVMAAMHLYHKKYFDPTRRFYRHDTNAIELKLAEELARAAMILQADNGGVRMAPLGTHRDVKDFVDKNQEQGAWWYNQISCENNISWYSAFQMLYQVTGNSDYKKAYEKIEDFFKLTWNPQEKYFYQGMNFHDGAWHPNDDHFALDVQTWGLAAFGPEKIDEWFGEGASYEIWQKAKMTSGYFSPEGGLLGVGFTEEHDRLSVEWTAGAILAAHSLVDYYLDKRPEWAMHAVNDAAAMRKGIDALRQNISANMSAYSYSSRRGWIPFGWNSHTPEVSSLASTAWVLLVDNHFNPFLLPQQPRNRATFPLVSGDVAR